MNYYVSDNKDERGVIWSGTPRDLKRKRSKTATARYMSALAVADLLVLSISAVEVWFYYTLQIHLQESSLAVCHAVLFCFPVLRAISAWILVAATVERAIGVWMPHNVKLICRPNIAAVIIGN
ncbi:hypothetical protein DPMN_123860 [Dreissena polymorpha]|uniref:G-protein coupled receptors family 1 profile domain-containing protein n=1 Tax=Dreissena polymorpha TaxID=45954 RepID=A0A9D4GVA2_DREPO|nr:hypothetical protein DPMN_123860 [Dreissena polymorpha]